MMTEPNTFFPFSVVNQLLNSPSNSHWNADVLNSYVDSKGHLEKGFLLGIQVLIGQEMQVIDRLVKLLCIVLSINHVVAYNFGICLFSGLKNHKVVYPISNTCFPVPEYAF